MSHRTVFPRNESYAALITINLTTFSVVGVISLPEGSADVALVCAVLFILSLFFRAWVKRTPYVVLDDQNLLINKNWLRDNPSISLGDIKQFDTRHHRIFKLILSDDTIVTLNGDMFKNEHREPFKRMLSFLLNPL